MKQLTQQQAQDVLLVFDEIQTGNLNEENINEVFKMLPDLNGGENTLQKARAINTFVISNNEELMHMATTLIVQQTEHPEQTGAYALESKVKPKAPARKRPRTKGKGKK